MLVDRRVRRRTAVLVAAATFDPQTRSLLLARELDDHGAWATVAFILCGLLLFGFIAS